MKKRSQAGERKRAGGPLDLQLAVAWVQCGRGVECHMGCKACTQAQSEAWTRRIATALGGRCCQSPLREWSGGLPQAQCCEASAEVGVWPAQSCSAGFLVAGLVRAPVASRVCGSYLGPSMGFPGFSPGVLTVVQEGLLPDCGQPQAHFVCVPLVTPAPE